MRVSLLFPFLRLVRVAANLVQKAPTHEECRLLDIITVSKITQIYYDIKHSRRDDSLRALKDINHKRTRKSRASPFRKGLDRHMVTR